MADQHGIPEVYPTWRELIASPRVELVSIVTPPHLHAEIAIAALAAGKHVICEKPTALNVAQAEAMLAAAQAAPGQIAIVDHELRFNPARSQLRRLLRGGYVGSPLYIHMTWFSPNRLDPRQAWDWNSDADRGGGVLGALGSHLFDLARWLVGRIDALSAQLQIGHYLRHDAEANAERRVTADDAAYCQLQFGGGVQGRVEISALRPGSRGMSVLVVGTTGALRIDEDDGLWGMQGADYPAGEWQRPAIEGEAVDPAMLPSRSPFAVSCYHLGRALAAALRGDTAALVDAATFYDGLVVQRGLDAARRSAREQAWVRL
jgi:predicted dehydrogenase